MTEDTRVYIEIPPEEVNYINRIIEGYEYLGVLTTLNAKRATCQINSTKDTRDTVIEVNDRICQFRIMENQPTIVFEEASHEEHADRGGYGSTGKQ